MGQLPGAGLHGRGDPGKALRRLIEVDPQPRRAGEGQRQRQRQKDGTCDRQRFFIFFHI